MKLTAQHHVCGHGQARYNLAAGPNGMPFIGDAPPQPPDPERATAQAFVQDPSTLHGRMNVPRTALLRARAPLADRAMVANSTALTYSV